jgi:membrane fusion protein (multidrug efflux system)
LSISRAVGNDWMVDSGLNAGDRLIIDGVQKIRAGATAEAVPNETVTAASRPDAAKHES